MTKISIILTIVVFRCNVTQANVIADQISVDALQMSGEELWTVLSSRHLLHFSYLLPRMRI